MQYIFIYIKYINNIIYVVHCNRACLFQYIHFLLLLLHVRFCGCLSLPPLVNRWRCARFIWCASVWRLAALPTNFLNSGVCVAGLTDDGTVNVPGVAFVVVVVVAFKCWVCVFVAFFALFKIVLLFFFVLDFCCFVFGLVVGFVVVVVWFLLL